MNGSLKINQDQARIWTLAIVGSLLLHASLLALVHRSPWPENPKVKKVVPVEAVTLVPGSPGRRGGGREVQTAPAPSPAPPPRAQPREVSPRPKPVKPVVPKPRPQLAPELTPPPAAPTYTAPPKPVQPTVMPKGASTPSPPVAAVPGRGQGGGQPGAGSGGGSGAGTGTGAGAGTGPGAGMGAGGRGAGQGSGAALKAYLQQVRRLLEQNKHYPSQARRLNQEGVVLLRFTIAAGGRIESAGVIRPSGHSLLDQAAQETLHRVRQFPPFPSDMGRERLTIEVPLKFHLAD